MHRVTDRADVSAYAYACRTHVAAAHRPCRPVAPGALPAAPHCSAGIAPMQLAPAMSADLQSSTVPATRSDLLAALYRAPGPRAWLTLYLAGLTYLFFMYMLWTTVNRITV